MAINKHSVFLYLCVRVSSVLRELAILPLIYGAVRTPPTRPASTVSLSHPGSKHTSKSQGLSPGESVTSGLTVQGQQKKCYAPGFLVSPFLFLSPHLHTLYPREL